MRHATLTALPAAFDVHHCVKERVAGFPSAALNLPQLYGFGRFRDGRFPHSAQVVRRRTHAGVEERHIGVIHLLPAVFRHPRQGFVDGIHRFLREFPRCYARPRRLVAPIVGVNRQWHNAVKLAQLLAEPRCALPILVRPVRCACDVRGQERVVRTVARHLFADGLQGTGRQVALDFQPHRQRAGFLRTQSCHY